VADPILLAGGGTAGHVNPLLAVADELRRRDPDRPITVLGTATGLEADLVPARGYPLVLVPRVPLPRRPTADWLRLPARLRQAVRAAGRAIDASGARVVVGFGGYVSTPAYLAARRRGIPIVVHEANARPGLANRLGARLTRFVGVTFATTALPHAVLTGMPLGREVAELATGDRVEARTAARQRLGLDPRAPLLLVTGGSLGAARLNSAVTAVARELAEAGVQVLHLTGRGKASEVRAAIAGTVAENTHQIREYLTEMDQAYAAADLVLARSGAATVSELAALGVPSVFVPLPIGNGEQRLNAEPVVSAGGALLVADSALTPDWLRAQLIPLLHDPERLAVMARAASGAGVVDGAARVVDLIERALASRGGASRAGADGAGAR